ncbi:Ferredoxin-1 [Pseudodesulfovibrio hydrargyri]|uniref:Ferredoxin-1 n=1 Tax=Pseudodesulfovibrio hydrargyri TaxID=2125990 RepID=A0A1J5N219_9BACT|nr:nitroreductase family protein [Pseudodesulfovibrio hydrargyri]OIQ52290.1 Ferredoxin-1 [Pseudodesulfovibrio hydrargyri]
MLNFTVDADKCTRCGECARDCPAGVIDMDGLPVVRPEREARCIECQHCLAICQPGALGVFGKDPADSLPLKGMFPVPAKMETLIMGRRSVRRYKKEGVDPALIRHLLDVASHAPTAVNGRPVTLTVMDDPAAMDRLRAEMTAEAVNLLHGDGFPAGWEHVADYVRGCEDGTDIIFRNAPHVLIASAPEDSFAPMADCHIVMSYFDLLASAHGLGTVWNGMVRAMLTEILPRFRTRLGIPENHLLACVMSFGWPAVKYHRTVQRPGGTIRRADF